MTAPIRGLPRICADDQPDVLEALRLLLKPEGFVIDTAASPQQLLRALELKDYDVVLMDLNYTRDTTSGEEGLDLLQRIHTADESLPVVVMTAWGSVNVAVEAMRRGARDFVQKPWDNERLLSIVRTQTELGRAIRRGRQLEAANQALQADGRSPILAESAAMRPVLEMIARVGPSDANVLITGENGTGKSLVAQALHAVSPRASRPMVTVNAGGMAEGVFESRAVRPREGRVHRRQGRSRRPLRARRRQHAVPRRDRQRAADPAAEAAARDRDRRVRAARLVEDAQGQRAADLGDQRRPQRRSRRPAASGRTCFPAEHDRDPPAAAARSARGHPAARQALPPPARAALSQARSRGFDPAAMQVLLDHRWPGNVRELDHAVERAVLMAQGHDRPRRAISACASTAIGTARLEDMSLEEVEAFLIKKAMARYGNVSHAARALGLSRSALYRRLERYKL